MTILFIILVLCVGAILLTVGLIWLRYRWHLRRSDQALQSALADIQREHESMDNG